jgi:hypothetical protein
MRTIAAASLLSLALAAPLKKRDTAGYLAPLSAQGETIDDSYIVVFKKDVKTDQIALHLGSVEESHGLDVSLSTPRAVLSGKRRESTMRDELGVEASWKEGVCLRGRKAGPDRGEIWMDSD